MLFTTLILHIKLHTEKRLECLMMLQIHRSDTPSIDAVIDRFPVSEMTYTVSSGMLNPSIPYRTY